MLSRNQILQAKDLKRERVDVPEWAEEGQPVEEAFVYIRLFTAAETFALGDKELANDTRMYRAIVESVCDEQGEPVLTIDDLDALATKSRLTVEMLFDRIAKFNKMSNTKTKDELNEERDAIDEQLRQIEEEEEDPGKNSEATPADDSS